MRRWNSDTVGGLFWIGVGLFFALYGLKLRLGVLRNPGPGFLPLIMALIMIFLALIVLAKGIVRPEGPLKKLSWKRHTLAIASVFFYGLLLEAIGFLLSTFVLMFILFGLLVEGDNRWRRVSLYAGAGACASWLVFSVALKIPFPHPYLVPRWM